MVSRYGSVLQKLPISIADLWFEKVPFPQVEITMFTKHRIEFCNTLRSILHCRFVGFFYPFYQLFAMLEKQQAQRNALLVLAYTTFALYFVYKNPHNPQNWTLVVIPLSQHAKAESRISPRPLILFLSQTLHSRQDSYWSQSCARTRVLAHNQILLASPAASPHYQMLHLTLVISVTDNNPDACQSTCWFLRKWAEMWQSISSINLH